MDSASTSYVKAVERALATEPAMLAVIGPTKEEELAALLASSVIQDKNIVIFAPRSLLRRGRTWSPNVYFT